MVFKNPLIEQYLNTGQTRTASKFGFKHFTQTP